MEEASGPFCVLGVGNAVKTSEGQISVSFAWPLRLPASLPPSLPPSLAFSLLPSHLLPSFPSSSPSLRACQVVKGVGGLSHEEYRRFLTDKAISDTQGFVDGDLIESFLELPTQRMEEVVELMRVEGVGGESKTDAALCDQAGGGKGEGKMEVVGLQEHAGKEEEKKDGVLSLDEVYRRVEDMTRLH